MRGDGSELDWDTRKSLLLMLQASLQMRDKGNSKILSLKMEELDVGFQSLIRRS